MRFHARSVRGAELFLVLHSPRRPLNSSVQNSHSDISIDRGGEDQEEGGSTARALAYRRKIAQYPMCFCEGGTVCDHTTLQRSLATPDVAGPSSLENYENYETYETYV